jgi:hypothetical protein
LEALTGSRYLLFRYPDDWTEKQIVRANLLFDKCPETGKVYRRSCEFRDWMRRENVGKNLKQIGFQLKAWMRKVEGDDRE